MEQMLAAVYKGNGVLDVEEVNKPHITHPNDVIIKVGAASICGSDLHILSVPPGQHADDGVVLGHEYYGYVDSIGSEVTDFKIGDCVVMDNIKKCGTCEYCRSGKDNLCTNAVIYGQNIDGGFAQYCKVPSSQLYSMPTSVPSSLAAQTEPLACVLNGIKKINPTPEQNILIFGVGPIGLTFIRVLKLYGVRHVGVCELSEVRRKKALECGADIAINPSKEGVRKAIENAWGGMCDTIIDAVGAGAVTEQALDLLNCGGTLLVFGQDANAISRIQPASITRNELVIRGTYCAHNTFCDSIKMLSDPRLELERIISHKLELKDIKEGIELLRTQKASRVIIYPNGFID
ncbi:MAG: alcohol dehydrogenase catalytic domain-containing protein [Saccharofermentanales bacterium]|jgi:threonine dehydrogenase-like Zn-dependent dehydrogenase